ncbi:hypothetical protein [Actinacidiphila paucisporea]|uniref:Uncharacterized protein n=1 Tax=Actinacidiphila paucisporea TaxID=310782 RepID=A0A1M7FRM9_9ACTN|nr:hypothetical protein [Actinacidiphila paucisporea]SHM06734.1 hypothetical protein SAMN05216499_10838 [Actinacidiphila paucisporea]
MRQTTDDHENSTTKEALDFGDLDFSDLDLSTLSVISMDGPAAKTDFGAADSWPPSCCCYPN